MSLPPWDPDDSAALDRRIRQGRRREQKERGFPTPEPRGKRTADPSLGRPGPTSQPRQLRNGRWFARRTVMGQQHAARFDTRAEAQAWLDQLREESI